IRPILSEEKAANEVVYHARTGAEKNSVVLTPSAEELAATYSKPKSFTFDRVLGQSTSQEEVFHEVEDLASTVLNGQRVCLFAYGQTGSGKTHTMEGTAAEEGIIPRCLRLLLDANDANNELHCYSTSRVSTLLNFGASSTAPPSLDPLQLSAIQVYGNKAYDMLLPSSKFSEQSETLQINTVCGQRAAAALP
ncbi:KIN14B, partial [Symbiodinium sp. KB8]